MKFRSWRSYCIITRHILQNWTFLENPIKGLIKSSSLPDSTWHTFRAYRRPDAGRSSYGLTSPLRFAIGINEDHRRSTATTIDTMTIAGAKSDAALLLRHSFPLFPQHVGILGWGESVVSLPPSRGDRASAREDERWITTVGYYTCSLALLHFCESVVHTHTERNLHVQIERTLVRPMCMPLYWRRS